MGSPIDRTSFDRLMVTHMERAHRFAIRLTGDADSAQEVMQDALLRASRGWESFAGRSRFETWLFQVVLNAFRDRKRARPGAQQLPEDLCDRRAEDPGEQASAAEQGELIARLVSALPPRQREVLVLIVYEHMSITEAACVLRLNEQNVRANLAIGRRRLREALSPYLQREQS